MINRLSVLFLILCIVLVGCGEKIDIQYDSQYGVKYQLDDSKETVVVHLDPVNNDIVSSILITSTNSNLDEDISFPLMSKYYNYPPFDNEKEITYYFSKMNDSILYQEFIEIDFYRIENYGELQDLIQYLGLDGELEDGLLYYKDELLKSSNFKFNEVLKSGVYTNNISLTQEEKYEYKK